MGENVIKRPAVGLQACFSYGYVSDGRSSRCNLSGTRWQAAEKQAALETRLAAEAEQLAAARAEAADMKGIMADTARILEQKNSEARSSNPSRSLNPNPHPNSDHKPNATLPHIMLQRYRIFEHGGASGPPRHLQRAEALFAHSLRTDRRPNNLT